MKNWTIKEIEEKLQTVTTKDDPFWEEIGKDARKGVQLLKNRWDRRFELMRKEEEKFLQMTSYEQKYYEQGFQLIAGIDEVGRGPLAGPVVAAAVILPKDFRLLGLDDSKKLSEEKREEFYLQITEQATAFGIGVISAEEIDRINIYEATKKAMLAAIQELPIKPEFLLIDAMKLETPYPFESIIKGDGKSISIAAASIVAKVTRDRYMKELDKAYPPYQFHKNMGYGTKEHLKALKEYGYTPFHRKSFEPIKSMVLKN